MSYTGPKPTLRDPKTYTDALADLASRREVVDGLVDVARLAEAIVAATGHNDSSRTYCSMGIPGGFTIQGMHIVTRAKTMKDAVPILRAVSASGRKFLGVDDDSSFGRRLYRYGDITVSVFFDKEDAYKPGACHWVKTGEEMTPKYKLVCEDTPPEVTP